MDRTSNSRMKRGDLRHRSLFCDLPAGLGTKKLLPPSPPTAPVSRCGSVAVSSAGDHSHLFRQERNLRPCARLTPNTPSGQMRLSSSLRVATQSFSAAHCSHLIPQTASPPSGTPVPRLRPGLLLSQPPAVGRLATLQLGCSVASSGSCSRSPDCGFGNCNRNSLAAFAAISFRPFFALDSRLASRR